jgi:hypothetical protein
MVVPLRLIAPHEYLKGARATRPHCVDAVDTVAHTRVIMTIYNPISANLNATEPENGGEADGKCVAARRETT